MNNKAAVADDFDDFVQEYLTFQRFRNGVLKPRPQMLLLKNSCNNFPKLNTLYLLLNEKVQWRCGDCKECNFQQCPNALNITLYLPLLTEQGTPALSRSSKNNIEMALNQYFLALEISTIAEWTKKSEYQNRLKHLAEIVTKTSEDLRDEAKTQLFQMLDEVTRSQPMWEQLKAQ